MSQPAPVRVRLPQPPVCLITDHSVADARLVEHVAASCAAGCRWVQLRAPGWEGRSLMALGRSLREITREAGATLVVNDRADVALALDADGLHLPAAGMRTSAARDLMGAKRLLGVSVHSSDEITERRTDAIDYFQFGPIYDTPSKVRFGPPQGIAGLRGAVVAAGEVPVIAVGGIRTDRVGEVLHAGAAGVAVIGAILHSHDAAAATRELLAEAGSVSRCERRR